MWRKAKRGDAGTAATMKVKIAANRKKSIDEAAKAEWKRKLVDIVDKLFAKSRTRWSQHTPKPRPCCSDL